MSKFLKDVHSSLGINSSASTAIVRFLMIRPFIKCNETTYMYND